MIMTMTQRAINKIIGAVHFAGFHDFPRANSAAVTQCGAVGAVSFLLAFLPACCRPQTYTGCTQQPASTTIKKHQYYYYYLTSTKTTRHHHHHYAADINAGGTYVRRFAARGDVDTVDEFDRFQPASAGC